MSSKFVEKQNEEVSEVENNEENQFSEKKPLRNVLASYMKKEKPDRKNIEKLKEEFLHIKDNMKDAKNSFETMMDIQKKLSKAYSQINEKEEEIPSEKNI